MALARRAPMPPLPASLPGRRAWPASLLGPNGADPGSGGPQWRQARSGGGLKPHEAATLRPPAPARQGGVGERREGASAPGSADRRGREEPAEARAAGLQGGLRIPRPGIGSPAHDGRGARTASQPASRPAPGSERAGERAGGRCAECAASSPSPCCGCGPAQPLPAARAGSCVRTRRIKTFGASPRRPRGASPATGTRQRRRRRRRGAPSWISRPDPTLRGRRAAAQPRPGGSRMAHPPSPRSCSRGPPACDAAPSEPSMNVHIHTTTGARYELAVPLEETVEGLKRRLAQRLKVPKERLALLHRDSHLNSGKLQDLGVVEGSKLTLVPTVEAGLMSQASRPEQSVMQALESLTETQVNDFLSGRSPLTLALRVGDHMMFVQLQLAAQQNGSQVQHRHVIASRGEPAGGGGGGGTAAVPVAGPATSSCRTFHGGSGSRSSSSPSASGFSRVPACQQSPASSPAAPPSPTQGTAMYCNTAHPSPVTAGMFRSHGAGAQPVSSSSGVVSSCSEVDCTARSDSLPGTSPAQRSRKPGAVIESFVNHAPGVFSGTFSGTLHPNCQDSSGRPRRDIGTILQILNDLLSATRHYQGMPHSLTQLRCQTQCSLSSSSPPLSPDLAHSTTSEKMAAAAHQPFHSGVQCPSQAGLCKPSGDRLRQTENRATRCKVERLQLLMQQKRLRRKARREARAPYHWLPNRKPSHSRSRSRVSSEGSLDLDFEDSVWKPEVKADLKSEFVVA
ncbi:midnolin [Paroedura picta]|uniref:midnolin n=1 Tax=Paroedura picta TaxID=143630 RepID=UPI004055D21B